MVEDGIVEMGEGSIDKKVMKKSEEEEHLVLFTPFKIGPYEISHRIVLAPLTRGRSPGRIAQASHAALYYAQRTSPGGFLIAEATGVSATAEGWKDTPAIWNDEQTEAWKPIVKAVHDKGGIFFCQIWHLGRFSAALYQPNGGKPISSTNRPVVTGKLLGPDGTFVDYSEPRALETHEIPSLINDFVISAKNAIAAGFDGVEIHGAHGFIVDQFLKDSVNDRMDKYGGPIENRCRFPLELVDAMVAAIGAGRVGIRLSPFSDLGDATDSDPIALGLYMAQELSKRKIAYVHYVEASEFIEAGEARSKESLWPFRRAFSGGAFLLAGGYNREDGNEAVKSGKGDAVVYGRHFLANPDLPRRFQLNAPLNKYDRATLYTGDPILGYTDYPFLNESHPEFAVPSQEV